MFPFRPRPQLVRETAKTIREAFKVTRPPVNSKKLLDQYAVIVEVQDSRYDGFASYIPWLGKYLVCVNKYFVYARTRFSYAHELGHIVLSHFDHVPEGVDSEPPERVRSVMEREADMFATELLMPAEWVYELAVPPISPSKMGRLKNKFGVSWEALMRRLDELHIQSISTSKELLNCPTSASMENVVSFADKAGGERG